MSHVFKDHDNKVELDYILTNVDLLNENSKALQSDLLELIEKINIASWYISDETLKMKEYIEDTPVEHLRRINGTFISYNRELVNFDITIRQCLFILNNYFNFDTPPMEESTNRVKGDM